MPGGRGGFAGASPLSLAVPEESVKEYVEQQAREEDGRRGGGGGRARRRRGDGPASATGRAGKSLAYMTVDELLRPARAWRDFAGGDVLADGYGAPRSQAELQGRWTDNGYYYVGNYFWVGGTCVACVLYKRPAALLGLCACLRAWDWLRTQRGTGAAARREEQTTQYKLKHAGVTALTWLVAVFFSVGVALMNAALATVALVLLHATFRKPNPRPLRS